MTLVEDSSFSIVRLRGGLGNQLFQYAFGRSVSLSRGVPLLLDGSLLEEEDSANTRRPYALGPFNISARLIDRAEAIALGVPTSRVGLWFARRARRFRGTQYVRERHFGYDAEILELARSRAIFEGYWQSEYYFQSCGEKIRKDLTSEESPLVQQISEEVGTGRSVSVHVRRGDYVTNPVAARFHGLCSSSYYERCFQFIESIVDEPRYYLFSDDQDWIVREVGRFPRAVVPVSSRYCLNAHEELLIMSRCRHHILANSSFSWWGAWLDERSDSVVVAPALWFQSGISTSDLIPVRWRRL